MTGEERSAEKIRNEVGSALSRGHATRGARDDEMRRLEVERQGILRLGELASTAPIDDLFDAIAEELARVVELRVDEPDQGMSALSQFNPDASMTVVAIRGRVSGYQTPIGSTWSLTDGDSANARVYATGGAARLEGGIPVSGSISQRLDVIQASSSIAVPIFVDDVLWGSASIVSSRPENLPSTTEPRLSAFAALASTAISSAQRREEVRRLADEQSAIRRIATVVARQPPLGEVYHLVCVELLALLDVDDVKVGRFEADGRTTVMGAAGVIENEMPVGYSVVLGPGMTLTKLRDSGEPVWLDSYEGVAGTEAGWMRAAGIQTSLGYPIRLGDTLWGALIGISAQRLRAAERVYPVIADCAELIATAIRNSDAAESLRASRERIVSAADESRRRFERNLHDGAQQRLVALSLELRHGMHGAGALDADAVAAELDSIVADLRDLSQGLHPAVLSESGLAGAIRMLVRRCPTPLTVSLPATWPHLSDRTQVACYYLLSEALTNIVKHSRARSGAITVSVGDDQLTVTVADDGVGGASLGSGSGLIGISDRVETLGGSLTLESAVGGGTTLSARLPLDVEQASSVTTAPGWG